MGDLVIDWRVSVTSNLTTRVASDGKAAPLSRGGGGCHLRRLTIGGRRRRLVASLYNRHRAMVGMWGIIGLVSS